jgi:hypothetical protein
VQISSLQGSQSLTIHLRACPRHVSHAEWHRDSRSTKKVRRTLGEVPNPVRRNQILEPIPAGRWGKPNDVAGAFW